MKKFVAATALVALAFSAPAFAQGTSSAAKPTVQERVVINTMKDVDKLMSKAAMDKINGHLAAAKAALKAGDDTKYEAEVDNAMMLLAKELYAEGSAQSR